MLVISGFVYAKLLGDAGNKIQAAYEVLLLEFALYVYGGLEASKDTENVETSCLLHGITSTAMSTGRLNISWGAVINIKRFIEANAAASWISEMIRKVVDIDSAKELRNSMSECWVDPSTQMIEKSNGPGKPGTYTFCNLNQTKHLFLEKRRLQWKRSWKPQKLLMPTTSSVNYLKDALNQASIRRTTIIVAHRLSALRHADLISVIQSGEVVESGSHEQLMQNLSGPFSIMVQLQRNFVDDEVTSKAQDTGSNISVVLDTEIANAEKRDNIQPLHSFCMASLLAVYLTTS
ncbi:TRANSPORTER FAMILY PROTEIN putative-RELATED [Salix koriyanagi]|uniref:TRANSPORTER FAMILY PROTEIN putative-RELATED n=1 Tax=Salix koriyanagi TaxID=2511006 RepID=A0A9Q0VFB6_9ROSI|nr:TRANSPORTER FAMILY PROTEIN putative-RELATED [Salix koriyanagi]